MKLTEKNVNLRTTILIIVLVAVIVGASVYAYAFYENSLTNTQGQTTGATYTIRTDGKNFWAINAAGHVQFSGTDASTVIQAALDALPSPNNQNAGVGGHVYITNGRYVVNTALQVHRATWVQGESITGTWLSQGTNTNDVINFTKALGDTDSIGFVKITDLGIAGHRGATAGYGIKNTVFSDNIIQHVWIDAMPNSCIFLGPDGTKSHIEDSWLESCRNRGIENYAAWTYITNNYISGNSWEGIYGNGSEVRMTGNRIVENQRDGIGWVSFGDNVISNNDFTINGQSGSTWSQIRIFSSSFNVITSNVFRLNAELQYPIQLGACRSCIVTSNSFEDSGSKGYFQMWSNINGLTIVNNPNANPNGTTTLPFSTVMQDGKYTVSPWGASQSAQGNNDGVSSPTANRAYVVAASPVFITSTGGTGVRISILDEAGNTIQSGLSSITQTYLPIGYQINFGGFSTAPTVTVFGC